MRVRLAPVRGRDGRTGAIGVGWKGVNDLVTYFCYPKLHDVWLWLWRTSA
jgi:hypothetical protein